MIHRMKISGVKTHEGYRWGTICRTCNWAQTFDPEMFSLAFEHANVHSYRMNRAAQSIEIESR